MTNLVISALLFAFAAGANAAGPSPTLEQYFSACRSTLEWAQYFPAFKPRINEVAYYPIGAIVGLQSRFSFQRFLSTLEKAHLRNGLKWNNKKQEWQFGHDSQRAAYGPKRRLTGIFYRGRIYIVDGHHRALVSLYAGAETVPVYLVDDWSKLYSPDRFMEVLRERQLSYFRDAAGAPTPQVDLCDMTDDTNLQLARFLIYRINAKADGKKIALTNGRGSDRPIAVKVNQDIHFFEFELADALTRAGIRFDIRRQESDLTMGELYSYLEILQSAARDKNSRLRQILLLDRPTPVAKLNFEELIRAHTKKPGCELLLMGMESDE